MNSMPRILATCIIVAVVASACGDDGENGATMGCDPALDGMVREPMPVLRTLFRLAPESTVQLPDGSREGLTGSLLVSDCFSPNTYYAGRIETLQLRSDTLAVDSGCAAVGTGVGSTLYGGDMPTSFSSSARINGHLVVLEGEGPAYGAGGLEVHAAAGGYDFHIVARIESHTSSRGAVPYCGDWGFL
jgi:hypothetical protein